MNVRSRHFTAEEILPSCQTKGLCAYLGIGVDGVGVAQIAVAFYLPLCVAAMLLYSAGRARSRAACCTLSVGGRLLGACAMLLIFLLYGPRIMSDREIDRIQLGASETLPRLDAVFGAPGFNFMKSWQVDSGVESWAPYGAVPTRSAGHAAPCQRRARLGKGGDGGKVVCLDDAPALLPQSTSRALQGEEECLAVSVGSNGDFSFEKDVHALNSRCRIETWDGTLSPSLRAPRYTSLIRSNFNATSWAPYAGKHVAVLKMDCEGCEHECLLPFVQHTCVDLILLELHNFGGKRTREVTRLMQQLTSTHALYYAEVNPNNPCCNEYALRRRNSTKHDSRCKR